MCTLTHGQVDSYLQVVALDFFFLKGSAGLKGMEVCPNRATNPGALMALQNAEYPWSIGLLLCGEVSCGPAR